MFLRRYTKLFAYTCSAIYEIKWTRHCLVISSQLLLGRYSSVQRGKRIILILTSTKFDQYPYMYLNLISASHAISLEVPHNGFAVRVVCVSRSCSVCWCHIDVVFPQIFATPHAVIVLAASNKTQMGKSWTITIDMCSVFNSPNRLDSNYMHFIGIKF